jgi:heme exporter protein CcmD
MMDFSAAHAGYVYASYGISAICILGLLVFVLLRDRSLQRKIKSRKDDA